MSAPQPTSNLEGHDIFVWCFSHNLTGRGGPTILELLKLKPPFPWCNPQTKKAADVSCDVSQTSVCIRWKLIAKYFNKFRMCYSCHSLWLFEFFYITIFIGLWWRPYCIKTIPSHWTTFKSNQKVGDIDG